MNTKVSGVKVEMLFCKIVLILRHESQCTQVVYQELNPCQITPTPHLPLIKTMRICHENAADTSCSCCCDQADSTSPSLTSVGPTAGKWELNVLTELQVCDSAHTNNTHKQEGKTKAHTHTDSLCMHTRMPTHNTNYTHAHTHTHTHWKLREKLLRGTEVWECFQ